MRGKAFIFTALAACGLLLFPSAAHADENRGTLISEVGSVLENADAKDGSALINEISSLTSDTGEIESSRREALSAAVDDYEAEKAAFLVGDGLPEALFEDEWNLQKNFQTFNFPSDVTIESVTPKYTVTSESDAGGVTALSIDEIMTVGYRDVGGTLNASAYAYHFTLDIADDTLLVTGISDTAVNFEALAGEGVKITADGITYEDTDNADGEKEDLAGASDTGSASDKEKEDEEVFLDVDAMVEYADEWALKFNPDYTSWAGQGGDCANFSSQCLYAGGIPDDYTWYKDSVAWINNVALRQYLSAMGYGYVVEDPDPSQMEAGDLLFYKWKSTSSRTNHVVVVVGRNSSGTPVVDSHTSAHLRAPWNYGDPAETYLLKMDYVREGVVPTNSDFKTMYRLYNPNSGEHFYTGSLNERVMLIDLGWKSEDIAWLAPVSGDPVYRLYNPNSGDHHYTVSVKERDALVKAGWKYEGIGWYSDEDKGVPLYRLYNPNAVTGSHHYTTSSEENKKLVSAGWKAEGISWYGVKE